MTRPRIVVTSRAFVSTISRLAEIGEVDGNDSDEPWPRGALLDRMADADAMMAFMPDSIDQPFLQGCRRLKIVACALKGYDNFDVAACTEAGVWVSIVPDLLTAPTAELAVGLVIGLGRMIREGDQMVRSGAFTGWRPILYGSGLDGATVTIIGMGRLGRAIAQRLGGFGCRLIGVDPHAAATPGVVYRELNEALPDSDYVVVAAPLTPGTRHLIGRDALARMRPGALLINVGRGSVVDEQAVADALAASKLGGFAADVLELEDWALPDRPRGLDPRLRRHPRTLFTPHIGSAVVQVRQAIEMRAADNIADVLCGRRPRDAINAPHTAD